MSIFVLWTDEYAMSLFKESLRSVINVYCLNLVTTALSVD